MDDNNKSFPKEANQRLEETYTDNMSDQDTTETIPEMSQKEIQIYLRE